MTARTPFEELASAMAAQKNPLARAMEAIEPVHLQALREQQERLFGPTKAISAIEEALKAAHVKMETSLGIVPGGEAIIKDSALYRSPARDVLDQLGAHRDIKPAHRGRPVPAPPSLAGGNGDAMPIASAGDIGRRVREVRLGMGMTQQRFADMAGVGRRFLIELEQGKASLEIGRVLAVCRAAGIKLGFMG